MKTFIYSLDKQGRMTPAFSLPLLEQYYNFIEKEERKAKIYSYGNLTVRNCQNSVKSFPERQASSPTGTKVLAFLRDWDSWGNFNSLKLFFSCLIHKGRDTSLFLSLSSLSLPLSLSLS